MIDIRQDEKNGEIIIVPPAHMNEKEGKEYVKKVIKEMQEMNSKSRKRDKWMLIVMFICVLIMGVSELKGDEILTIQEPKSYEFQPPKKEIIDPKNIKTEVVPRWCDGSVVLDFEKSKLIKRYQEELDYYADIWFLLDDLEKKEIIEKIKKITYRTTKYPEVGTRKVCVPRDHR